MMFQGRLVATLIGFILAGPIGAVMGFFIGSFLDQKTTHRHRFYNQNTQQQTHELAFFRATFLLMGYVAKSDGRVSQQEIQVTQQIMASLALSPAQKQTAKNLFRQGRDQAFSYHATIESIAPYRSAQYCQILINCLVQIALADGHIKPRQKQVITEICAQLGVVTPHFQHQQYQRYRHSQNQAETFSDPYKMMGIPSHAKTPAVRKAYRRLMSQYHPDKMAAKGASEAEIKQATDKTQTIRRAYEQILQARGLKK